MKCTNCGCEMPDTAKFCGNCGRQMTPPAPAQEFMPERVLLFTASAPMTFILNNETGTYWDIPEGESFIDLGTGLNEVELSFSGFHFGNPQNLTKFDFPDTLPIWYDSLECMFAECSALAELDLSMFKTGDVTTVDGMFEGCSSLFRLNLDGWDFEGLRSCRRMFWGCDSLRHVSMKGCNARTIEIIAKALSMAALKEVSLEYQ